jgi:hypothetical protein
MRRPRPRPAAVHTVTEEDAMQKLRLELDGLKVESFEAGADGAGTGTVRGHGGTCSMQPTCGVASRGEATFELEAWTRYACCV